MNTPGKFIMQAIGPIVKYRLDIIAHSYPKAKDYIIILTTKESYELYKEYHDFFEFFIIDEYRNDYPFSLEYEVFPNFKTEDEFFSNIKSFYNANDKRYFSYDIHRFIIPYLIEKNILNFALVDTDVILNSDPVVLESFFNNIPKGTCYGPFMSEDSFFVPLKLDFWKNEVQPYFNEIELKCPTINHIDGFIRGFNFNNKQEAKLLFEIWNKAIEKLYTLEKYNNIVGTNGMFWHTEWVIAYIMQFYKHQLNYDFKDAHYLLMINGQRVGHHRTRPEDTLHLGERWPSLHMNYSDTSSIANFVKNNKTQLKEYYGDTADITDTHVYSKINF